jgi:hypothetical protein
MVSDMETSCWRSRKLEEKDLGTKLWSGRRRRPSMEK